MQIKLPYKLSLSYKHTIYIANTPGSLSGMLSNRPTETEVFFLFQHERCHPNTNFPWCSHLLSAVGETVISYSPLNFEFAQMTFPVSKEIAGI